MKKAHYDETTKQLLGWYDTKVHDTIPIPNIEVTDEAWQEAISINATHVDITTKVFSIVDFRTDVAIKEALDQSITNKATDIIEATYSPLKQRKMLSVAVALQDKVINGGTLTQEEEGALQFNRDANIWITGKRAIENTAIAESTPLADIIWE